MLKFIFFFFSEKLRNVERLEGNMFCLTFLLLRIVVKNRRERVLFL